MIETLDRARLAFARWLLRGARIDELKVGSNTITVGAGNLDIIRWSASQNPTQAGDIGMNVATGRLREFVSGGVFDIALMADIPASKFRTIASGSTSIPGGGGAGTTLAQFVPNAGEAVFPAVAFEYTGTLVGVGMTYGQAATGQTLVGFEYWFQTTGNVTNELYFQCANKNALARTLRWAVVGYTF